MLHEFATLNDAKLVNAISFTVPLFAKRFYDEDDRIACVHAASALAEDATRYGRTDGRTHSGRSQE